MELRLSTPEDQLSLFTLFQESFGYTPNPQKWRWKYEQNPHGASICAVASHDNRLVGFYGLIPRKFQMLGTTITGFQETDLMVHPQWRGKRVFNQLGRYCYQHLIANGYAFTFGFPNTVSTPVGTKLLGWKLVCPMPVWNRYETMKPIAAKFGLAHWPTPGLSSLIKRWHRASQPSISNRFTCVIDAPASTSELAAFYAGYYQHNPIVGIRDAEYLAWRYQNQQDAQYRWITVYEDAIVIAAAVVKITCDKYRQAWVLEFAALPETRCLDALLGTVLKLCHREQVDVIRLWLLGELRVGKWLRGNGLRLRPTEIYHVVRPLQDETITRLVMNPDLWLITLGDSDCC